jgi:UDP-N-acetylglucosamine/UDP-N-acetylgalactosamine 4-epimerase
MACRGSLPVQTVQPVNERVDQSEFSQFNVKAERWLVTGVAGFIGSNILEALLRNGAAVRGIDNFSTGSQKNLRDVQARVGDDAWKRFEFLEHDIRNREHCVEACKGISVVLHQAALGSVPRSLEDPINTNQSNIDGFLHMLVASRTAGVKRFVYAASSSTYGDSEKLPKVEDVIGRPLSPYAVTKYVNELYADVFARAYGFQSIGLRYFNVFGPRQDPNGAYAAVIPRWVSTILQKERPAIFGDGETSRDFCFVNNVIQANLAAATTTDPAAVNQVYNVAVGGRTTLNMLFVGMRDRLAQITNDPALKKLEPVYKDFRAGDVRHSQANIDKAKRLLGFDPKYDLNRGLDVAMPWYVDDLSGRRGSQ